MKRIALSFYAISTFIVFILMSCTDQMTNNEDARQIIISASLRDHTPHTRVSITQDSESLNLLPKWEEDDKIDLFIIQDKNVYPVTSVPIRDIREGGSTCTISLTIPYQVDTEKPYTIIGLFDIEGETDADGQVKVKTQLKRLRWDTPTTPMYFKADGGPRSLIATFEHIGTYELLHIKNTSNKGIFFQHCGFETETPWYKYEDEIIVGKQETPQSTIFEKGEVTSGRYFIPKNESFNILSWYIPSGVQIRNAKLKSVIDGNQVVSSNAKNSSVQLQRGHAYHMYATWDGTELKFGKSDVGETLSLAANSIDLVTGFGGAVRILSGSGDYQVESSNPDVATAEIAQPLFDKTAYLVRITALNAGNATLTVTDVANMTRATINVVVTDASKPYTQGSYVDLGLPSGTLWATCNVGAESPEQSGWYVSWGEIAEKSTYSISNYSLVDAGNTYDIDDEHDVAYQTLGSSWCMPTEDQLKELFNCSWSWEDYNGVRGARITGPNGNTIFLPAASYKDYSYNSPSVGLYGSYWGRTHGDTTNGKPCGAELVFGTADYKDNWSNSDFYYDMGPTGWCYCGRSVRPVRKY